MNNRDYKIFGSGMYYHVYNRGNLKENIYHDKQDYLFFLNRLKQNIYPDENNKSRNPLGSNLFSLICYCLMPNHFHLLIKQLDEVPLSKLMLRLCTSYSKYRNLKYDKVGHVFQDQYKQVIIDGNEYLLWLSSYIHLNPVKAGIVKYPYEYRWSSFSEYLGKGDFELCQKDIVLDQLNINGKKDDKYNYRNFIMECEKEIVNRKDFETLLID